MCGDEGAVRRQREADHVRHDDQPVEPVDELPDYCDGTNCSYCLPWLDEIRPRIDNGWAFQREGEPVLGAELVARPHLS